MATFGMANHNLQHNNNERELMRRFEVQKFLGKGSYGSVFRVRRVSDNKTYALKETNVRHMGQAERNDAVNEIRLLASIRNTFVVGYHEAFIDGNRLCIVMECAKNGDLSKAIRKRAAQRKPLPEDLVWCYLIQIACAVSALHSQRVLHRDIKTANVLRFSNEVVKLGDLGVAKLMKSAMTHTQIGTPHYMPPELWRNRPYSFSSDIWGLGCVIFEMCTFHVPFDARSLSELRYKVLRGRPPPIPTSYSAELATLVRRCLEPEASNRPTVEDILASSAVRRRIHCVPEEVRSHVEAQMCGQPPPSAAPSTALSRAPSVASNASSMMETIKVPKNIRMLSRRLPAAFYPSESGSDDARPKPRAVSQLADLPSITCDSNRSSPGPQNMPPLSSKANDQARGQRNVSSQQQQAQQQHGKNAVPSRGAAARHSAPDPPVANERQLRKLDGVRERAQLPRLAALPENGQVPNHRPQPLQTRNQYPNANHLAGARAQPQPLKLPPGVYAAYAPESRRHSRGSAIARSEPSALRTAGIKSRQSQAPPLWAASKASKASSIWSQAEQYGGLDHRGVAPGVVLHHHPERVAPSHVPASRQRRW